MNPKNIAVVYYKNETDEFRLTINTVKETLKKYNQKFSLIRRQTLRLTNLKKYDLVIVVGGDGTFLKTMHFVKDQLVLGVTRDKNKSVGFFMTADRNDFERKFKRILDNRHKIKKITRLEAKIGNDKVKELATNEFYFGHKVSYCMSKYNIIVGKKKSLHKSSGVLISSPAGSTAWTMSAGGEKLPIDSKKIQYIVREPYTYKIYTKDLKKGVLKQNQDIKIESLSKYNILVVDSTSKEYSIKDNQKVTIKISNKPINQIVF